MMSSSARGPKKDIQVMLKNYLQQITSLTSWNCFSNLELQQEKPGGYSTSKCLLGHAMCTHVPRLLMLIKLDNPFYL